MKTHKDLDVWKDSVELLVLIYKETQLFPREELYGLTSQIRRAAVSIPANISEGSARNYSDEFIRFLRISLGSLVEVETLLLISLRLNYIEKEKFDLLYGSILKITSQLSGLIRSIQKGTKKHG
jgi:four helix bundle protein